MAELSAKQALRKSQLLQRKLELQAKIEVVNNKLKNIDEELESYAQIEAQESAPK